MEMALLNDLMKEHVAKHKSTISYTLYQLLMRNEIVHIQSQKSHRGMDSPLNYIVSIRGMDGEVYFHFIHHCEPFHSGEQVHLTLQDLFEFLDILNEIKNKKVALLTS